MHAAARRARRPAFWLALIAALAMACLPTLVRALAASSDAPRWVQLCTSQGMRLVALDMDADPSAPASQAPATGALDHCPGCLQHAPALGMPPAAFDIARLAARGAEPPLLFLHGPRTLHAWRSAHPRGPPILS